MGTLDKFGAKLQSPKSFYKKEPLQIALEGFKITSEAQLWI